MKPNFPNKMHLASKLFTTIHVVIIIHKHFFSPLTPLYNCPVINLKKSKIGVYKEEIFWNFFAGLLLVSQAKSVIAMKKAVSNVKDKLTTHKQRV